MPEFELNPVKEEDYTKKLLDKDFSTKKVKPKKLKKILMSAIM